MVRKSKKVVRMVRGRERAEPEEIGEFIEEIEDPAELEGDFAALPEEGTAVLLYRHYPEKGGRPKYLRTMTPQEFTLEAVRLEFGGGRFQVALREQSKVTRRNVFEIEGEPVVKRVTDAPPPVAPGQPVDLAGQLFTRLESFLTQRFGGQDLKGLGDLIKSVSTGQPVVTEEALLHRMKMYKDLFATASPASPVKEMMEAFMKGADLAMTAGGGEGGGNMWFTILREFKEPLTSLMQTINTAVNAPRVGQPLPIRAPTRPEGPTMPETPMTPTFKETIAPHLNLLVMAASRQSDTNVYADIILDQVSPEDQPGLMAWLKGDQWFKDLVMWDPRIELQQAWWVDLREMLLTPVEGEKQEPSPDGHETPAQTAQEAT